MYVIVNIVNIFFNYFPGSNSKMQTMLPWFQRFRILTQDFVLTLKSLWEISNNKSINIISNKYLLDNDNYSNLLNDHIIDHCSTDT